MRQLFVFGVGRLTAWLAVVFAVVSISFAVVRLAPGSPFDTERPLPASVRANIDARYGLNAPLWQQYLRYVRQVVGSADLGRSLRQPDRTVNEIIETTLPVSAVLGGQALTLALFVGLLAGIAGGSVSHGGVERAIGALTALAASAPAFVIGPLLLLAAQRTGWFDVSGWTGPSGGLLTHLRSSALPTLTLAPFAASYLARLLQVGVRTAMDQPFATTAFAKGLSRWQVATRHALRPALGPALGFLGPALATLLTGSVTVERIFNIPGMGDAFLTAAYGRDYPVLLGIVIVQSMVLVACSFGAELIAGALDPKVAHGA